MEYQRSSLNPAIRRKIKSEEKYLERKCRKIWDFTNPEGIKYLFGSFCQNRDSVIVTIAIQNLDVIGGWEPAR